MIFKVLATFLKYDPHLLLMDISLPFYNGYYWCTEIRKISKVPIIFLSSRADKMDIIMAINMGGDDYISKPISMDLLTSKIQACSAAAMIMWSNRRNCVLEDII